MPDARKTEFQIIPAPVPGIDLALARTTRSFPRHFHDQFGIGLILSGAHRSASGRGPVEAVRGDVIAVNPGETHDGAPVDGRSRAWAMLYIDPRTVASIALDLSEGRSVDLELAHPARTDPAAASLFIPLFRSLAAGRYCQTMDGEAALIVLIERLIVQRAVSGGAATPSGLRRVREAIDDNPTARHTLNDLATISGLGRFRLIRAFAAETGLTPHAYATQVRLQAARRLLRAGLSLAEASAEAGFADQSHMTRVFARSYGFTPGAYAKAKG